MRRAFIGPPSPRWQGVEVGIDNNLGCARLDAIHKADAVGVANRFPSLDFDCGRSKTPRKDFGYAPSASRKGVEEDDGFHCVVSFRSWLGMVRDPDAEDDDCRGGGLGRCEGLPEEGGAGYSPAGIASFRLLFR